MDLTTARTLNALTTDFYRRVGTSFSETRQAPWEGWKRAIDQCADALGPDMRLLDVGCGNLRFERFVEQEAGGFGEAYVVDNCEELVSEGARSFGNEEPHGDKGEGRPSSHARRVVFFQNLDIADVLLEGADLSSTLQAPACDLCVAFGLMHHLPTFEARASVLQALVGHTRAGGYVVLAFWQFAHNDKLLAKAAEATARGCAELGITLGENDYLLGWKNEQDAFRFCHHFEEDEIDRLARGVSSDAVEAARFSADGKTSDLNRYLVLRAV